MQALGSSEDDKTAIVLAERYVKFAFRIDTGSDIPASMSNTIVKFLDEKRLFLSTRGNSNLQELLAAYGRPVKYYGESQIFPLMKTESVSLHLRNINVKIIQCSENYVEPEYDCAEEIFLGNTPFEAAGFHVKDFFADHIDHRSCLDFGTILPTDEPNKVGKI